MRPEETFALKAQGVTQGPSNQRGVVDVPIVADQTKLTLTGYRRESFVIDRVVTSGKEGLDTHHIVPIRCVKHATNDRSLTSVSSWVMYNSSKAFDRNRH